jgi:tetratricopeptide (TPR) repeat protein
MKRPQLVSSGSLERMIKTADEAWSRRDFQQAIETLERACRLNPGNPIPQIELGCYYGLRSDYAAAERFLDNGIRFSPNKIEAITSIALKCTNFTDKHLAEKYLKLALDQKTVSPQTCALLAELYERQRRMDEANALIDRALQLDGKCPLALVTRARFERLANQLEQAEKTVRILLSLPDPGAQESMERDIRIRGWYELGAILDKQKRYDDAMAAFLQAKTMQRMHAGNQLAVLQMMHARVKMLRDNLTEDVLKRWFDFGAQLQPPRPLALLGGHPRSGTTLLEQVLDSHPDIISAEETNIFYDDALRPLTVHLQKGEPPPDVLKGAIQQSRENYFKSMELFLGNPIGSRLLIDKNPVATVLIPYFVRIFPEIKFLVALRDPRDVCISNFTQNFAIRRRGKDPLGNLAGYLSLEGVAKNYAVQMGMWTAAKPLLKNPWLEVRYEDIVSDLESVSRKALEFLGVPWDDRVLKFSEHAQQKAVRSPTYADVTKPVFKTAVGRWRNYQKFLEPHLATLEPFAKAFGYE